MLQSTADSTHSLHPTTDTTHKIFKHSDPEVSLRKLMSHQPHTSGWISLSKNSSIPAPNTSHQITSKQLAPSSRHATVSSRLNPYLTFHSFTTDRKSFKQAPNDIIRTKSKHNPPNVWFTILTYDDNNIFWSPFYDLQYILQALNTGSCIKAWIACFGIDIIH